MVEGDDLREPKRNPATTRAERLAAKIIKANAGAAVTPVKLSATISGPSAASWKALLEAKGRLELDDAAILGLLLEAGCSTVRQALQAAQPD